jgi:ankyrin repeat protein
MSSAVEAAFDRRSSIGLTGQQLRLETMVRAGDIERLRTMMQTSLSSHIKTDELLEVALVARQLACIPPLIEAGADVNARSAQTGLTALLLAAQNGLADAVTPLLEAHADVAMRAGGGSTCLHLAAATAREWASYGESDEAAAATIALLLAAGADARAVDDAGRTAAHDAAEGSNVPVLEAIGEVDGGALLLPDSAQLTPLHAGAAAGALHAVEWLLHRRAAMEESQQPEESADKSVRTPIACATAAKQVAVVQLLLDAGAADVNDSSADGTSLLMIAAKQARARLH